MATNCDAIDLKLQLSNLMEQIGRATSGKIDEKLNAALGLANVDIDALRARVQALETVLDADPSTPEYDAAQNIITQLGDIVSRLNSMEDPSVAGSLANQIAALNTQIAGIVDNYNALNGAINANGQKIANIASALGIDPESVFGGISGATHSYSTIVSAVSDILSMVESNSDTLATLTASAATDGSIANQLAALEGTLRQYIDDRIANVDLSALETRVDSLEQRMGTAEQAITTLEGSVTQLGADLSNVTGRVSDVESRMGDAETAIAGLNQRVTANETALNALTLRVDNNEQCVATMYNELSAVATGVADLLNSFVAGLEAGPAA